MARARLNTLRTYCAFAGLDVVVERRKSAGGIVVFRVHEDDVAVFQQLLNRHVGTRFHKPPEGRRPTNHWLFNVSRKRFKWRHDEWGKLPIAPRLVVPTVTAALMEQMRHWSDKLAGFYNKKTPLLSALSTKRGHNSWWKSLNYSRGDTQ